MLIRALVVLVGLLAPYALASDVAVGGQLSDLSVAKQGELVLTDGEVGYQVWDYPQHPGKVHVLQYMAATQDASKINKAFTDAMKAQLPKGAALSTTIVNLDEATWGTGGFVLGKLKSNKVEFPGAVIVADEEGAGLKQWQLQQESSAVIVTDKDGVVLFFKQGAMSAAEVESTLALIKQHI